MLNIQSGIRSLTEFKQHSSDILGYIKKTRSPAILTVNGKAEVVLLDPKTYQNMVDQISLIESSKNITTALIEMENDRGIPAKEVFKKLRKKFAK
jgi:PHD/YefM family antitoxin component YafN of YafNO toxin-antitoxin module